MTTNLNYQNNPLSGNSSKQRVAVLLEYNGMPFAGSQYQPNQQTVQGALIQALNSLNIKFSSMMFAGRTDAGVHAKGQVAHFDMPLNALSSIENFTLALQQHLPPEIAVRNICLNVNPDFHSQRQASYKWYRYKMYLGPHRSVWMPPDAAYIKNCYLEDTVSSHATLPRIFNLNRLNAAAGLIEGQHSFKSFQCSGIGVQNDVCDIMKARFHLESASNSDCIGNILVFDIVGDRFLYKMVRSLLGQLIAIGYADPKRFGDPEKWLDPAYILEVLARQNRSHSAQIAPAAGLSLMSVVYPKAVDYFANDPLRQTLSDILSESPACKDPVHSDSPSASSFGETPVLENQYSTKPQMEPNSNEDLLCKAS